MRTSHAHRQETDHGAASAESPRARLATVPAAPDGVDTTPLPAPLSAFDTRRLVERPDGGLAIVPSRAEHLFAAALVIVGLAFGAGGLAAVVGEGSSGTTRMAGSLALVVALPPILLGLVVTRLGGRVVIDPVRREVVRSGGAFRSRAAHRSRIAFADITGVQRLPCPIVDEEARWTVHQVNLLLRGGRRKHLCSFADAARARDAAARINSLVT